MASRSFQVLFLRARDQRASTLRWTGLTVLALLLAHAAVLTPLLEAERARATAADEQRRTRAVAAALAELEARLASAVEEGGRAVAGELEHLAEATDRDLEDLAAAIQELRSAEPEEGDEPEAAATGRTIENLVIRQRIRDAADDDELLAAVAPAVEGLVVRPRYAELNRVWTAAGLPAVEARLDGVASEIPRLHGELPEARPQWEALAAAVAELRRSARELLFVPPEAQRWWARSAPTPEGEVVMRPGLDPAMAQRLLQPLALDSLAVAGNAARRRLEELAAVVDRRLGELGTAGAGHTVTAALLAAAPTFPLVLGLVLAAIIAWRSQRLRELAAATHFMSEHGGPPGLRGWCLAELRWGLAAERPAGGAWGALALQALLGLAAAALWIAAAAAQLQRLGGSDPERLTTHAALGGGAVLLATLHRLFVAHRAVALLAPAVPRDEDPVPDSDPDPDPAISGAELAAPEDDEVLDALSLRH